jgi:hypothetical protein
MHRPNASATQGKTAGWESQPRAEVCNA